jgi:anti-anti-sigma factor
MTSEDIVYPLFDGAESSDAGDVGTRVLVVEQPARKTSLESERLGLLAGPGTAIDPERRIEEWIASNLDLDLGTEAAHQSAWTRMIEGLARMKRPARSQRGRTGGTAVHTQEGWDRFEVAYRRGITVVKLIDRTLVREAQVRELACDLLDLIAAGNHRIVLDFQVVERVASWVVIAATEASRRCALQDGGALKVCGLQPQLASIFPITGMPAKVAFYPDLAAAIDGPWPEASGPRPLPIEILAALTSAAEMAPIRGGAPAEAARPEATAQPTSRSAPPAAEPLSADVWLRVQVGGAKGRTVALSGSRFVIGRDRSCELRLGSATVSKFHAAIERRDNRVFVRDLASTNGTIVNGRLLHNAEAEVKDSDRIQIGPIVSTLAVGAKPSLPAKVEEMVAGWLSGDGTVNRADHHDSQATELNLIAGDAAPEGRIKFEVIQDVLVVTPQVPELDDSDTIEFLRSHLRALFEPPAPRHVVVNLEYIRHLSAAAIGVILAHHLRLDRAGGGLRICQAHARVMAILHQVRLTVLVECYPTLDEAVLGAWPSAGRPPF